MLTDYDIQRLSKAIVSNLVNDERFMIRMVKIMPKQKKMVSSGAAAKILGVSRKTVCTIAEQLGGIKEEGKSSHWIFEEEGLVDRYLEYKKRKK